jgi:hypothetical protein
MTWRAVPALLLIPLVFQFLLGNANGWRSSGPPGGAQCAPYEILRYAQNDKTSFPELSQFIDYPEFLTENRKPKTENRLFPLLLGDIFINLKSLRRMRHVIYV